jgi:hypothetical protein
MSERNEKGYPITLQDEPDIARRNLLKMTGIGVAALGIGSELPQPAKGLLK